MTEKIFHFLKKHYETIEEFAYVGMIFWFVPFLFAIFKFRNDIIVYICIIMFLLHFMSCLLLFDDDRLWRWIR